ncbi:hypothetical protein T08_13364 [Trichinella sp. T8]|nr:hypothetical protein T08_13364 [Trichinella sp. T8]
MENNGKKLKERFSENSMHSEFEAALTAILLGAVHRFLSAFKVGAQSGPYRPVGVDKGLGVEWGR